MTISARSIPNQYSNELRPKSYIMCLKPPFFSYRGSTAPMPAVNENPMIVIPEKQYFRAVGIILVA